MFVKPSVEKSHASWRGKFIKGGLIVLVFALIGGTGFVLFMKIKFSDFTPTFPPANVVVSTVEERKFVDSIEAIGTTVANQSAVLTATVTETIKSINAEEGQFVSKGAPIIELHNDEESAMLDEAQKSYRRYDSLARAHLGSDERRDEEEAAMNVARAQLDKRKISAPFDGFLGIRHLNVGDLVTPGIVVTTIDAIDPIKIDFTVPENFLSAIHVGMKVSASTTAWPDKGYTGTIYVIDSRIDPETRSIAVRATVPNPDGELKAGLLMKVIIIKSDRTATAVPESAVTSYGDNKYVYVVDANKKIIKKAIVTGQREPGYVEVTSGLSVGDKVVIEGQMKARPEAVVNVVGEKKIAEVIEQTVQFALPNKKESFENATAGSDGRK